MRFPTADAIIDLHAEILAKTGGHAGILNRGLIDSALERAAWGPFVVEPDLATRAAFLLRGLCQDHPFADGNKRTAYEATDLFLSLNGRRLEATPAAAVPFMLAVAQAEVSVEGIRGVAPDPRKGLSRDGGHGMSVPETTKPDSDAPPKPKGMTPEERRLFEASFRRNEETLRRLAKL